jgi:hypothetical protein
MASGTIFERAMAVERMRAEEDRVRADRDARRAEFIATATKGMLAFSSDDQLLILAALGNAVAKTGDAQTLSIGAQNPSTIATVITTDTAEPSVPGEDAHRHGERSASALWAIEASGSTGCTVEDVARAAYGDPTAFRKARSLLGYLQSQSDAHSIDGKWFKGPGADRPKDSDEQDESEEPRLGATALVRQVIGLSAKELRAADVVTAVHQINHDIPSTHIYAALSRLAKGDGIVVHERPDGRTYERALKSGRSRGLAR